MIDTSYKQILVDHTLSSFIQPAQDYVDHLKHKIAEYILSGRVSSQWQECAMIAGIAAAVIGVVFTFFAGSTLLCSCFIISLAVSSIGAYYMHYYAMLQDLEETISDLRQTQVRYETIANDLQRENTRLEASNETLSRSLDEFRQANEQFRLRITDLEGSIVRLDAANQTLEETRGRLERHVADLTLQVTHLSQSADQIRQEMLRFQSENAHLAGNIRGFDTSLNTLNQQINTSRALCAQIELHLTAQREDFGRQVGELRQLITDLRTNDSTNEKLALLTQLNGQIQAAAAQLGQLQAQFAAERANYESIRVELARLRDSYAATNRDLRGNVNDLRTEREAIQNQRLRFERLLNTALNPPPRGPGPIIPAIPRFQAAIPT